MNQPRGCMGGVGVVGGKGLTRTARDVMRGIA